MTLTFQGSGVQLFSQVHQSFLKRSLIEIVKTLKKNALLVVPRQYDDEKDIIIPNLFEVIWEVHMFQLCQEARNLYTYAKLMSSWVFVNLR